MDTFNLVHAPFSAEAVIQMNMVTHDKLLEALDEHNLTYLEWRLLSVLLGVPSLSAYRLGVALNRAQATAIATANRLQMRGWLTSFQDGLPPVRLWRLTPKAHAVLPAPIRFVDWIVQSPEILNNLFHHEITQNMARRAEPGNAPPSSSNHQ